MRLYTCIGAAVFISVEAGDHIHELMCNLLVSCVNAGAPALMPAGQHACCRGPEWREACLCIEVEGASRVCSIWGVLLSRPIWKLVKGTVEPSSVVLKKCSLLKID